LRRRLNLPDEEIRRLYLEEEMGSTTIAKMFGVSPGAISERLKGIRRTRSEGARLAAKHYRKPLGANKFIGGKGEANIGWKGGRSFREGYIVIWSPDHHRSNGGYVYEHILVWEQHHKLLLSTDWVVHHINGVKTDNRIENLIAYPRIKHDRLIPLLLTTIKSLRNQNERLKAGQTVLPIKAGLEVM